MPTAPPNSGPKDLDIMKYDPPPGTTPLVAMALMEMAVSNVCRRESVTYYYEYSVLYITMSIVYYILL